MPAPPVEAAPPRGEASRRPRIAFNALLLALDAGYRSAGIHRYLLQLLRALADQPVDVVAFTADGGARAALPGSIDVRRMPGFLRAPWRRVVFEQAVLGSAATWVGADLLHCPAFAVPAVCRVPRVVTVHDLSFVRLPEAAPRARRAYLTRATRHAVRVAERIVTISRFTASELVNAWGVDSERIRPIPLAVGPEFTPMPPDRAAAEIRAAGLPSDFILTVGTLEPRKNLGTLLAAYGALAANQPTCPDLVVVGGRGWGEVGVAARASEFGAAGRVHEAGYVSESLLRALYSACRMFAFPSLYEGFGLPVLEAMSCGAPTIIADAGSLPEVAGSAAITVPPADAAAWLAAVESVLRDERLALTMAGEGRRRAATFSWQRTARETVGVYREVMRADRARLAATARAIGPW